MNSRERVLTALKHKEPDRIPIDFGGVSTSIHYIAYKALLNYLGLQENEAPILERTQMIVDPSPALKEKFHSDVISLFANSGSNWKLEIDPIKDSYKNEWGVIYQRPKNGFWYDIIYHPLVEGTFEELNKYKFPDPQDINRVKGLSERVQKLYKETDKVLFMCQSTGSLFESSWILRGMENFYIDLAFNKKYVEALAEKLLEYMIKWWSLILDNVGNYMHILNVGGDLGSQTGPLFNPEIYYKIYKPREKILNDFLHKKAPSAFLFMHCCGSIYTYIPHIIEIGYDIINPVQLSAKDMESHRLKKEFGKDLVFWGGGADATKAMTLFTPEQLKEEVKRRIHDFAPGGGFVFAPVHNIQVNVPPQNVVAFFKAAYEYGKYPIKV